MSHRRSGTREPVLQEVGQYMRKRRLDLGLSTTDVAQRAGVWPETVERWESGFRTPHFLLWMKWCQALRLDWWPQEPGNW